MFILCRCCLCGISLHPQGTRINKCCINVIVVGAAPEPEGKNVCFVVWFELYLGLESRQRYKEATTNEQTITRCLVPWMLFTIGSTRHYWYDSIMMPQPSELHK